MKTAVVSRTAYYQAIKFENNDPCGWIVIPDDERRRLGLREIDSTKIPKDAIARAHEICRRQAEQAALPRGDGG